MKLISVSTIEVGMVLAEDIYSKDGVIYLNAGAILKARHVSLLQNLKVEFIYIEAAEDHQIIEHAPNRARLNYSKEFKQTLGAFKEIYTNVTLGKQVIIKEVEESLEPLVDGILNNNDILGSLRNIEVMDDYTFRHSINVSLIASMLGKWLGYEHHHLKKLSIAGLLHDLGKSKIPIAILNKPAALSAEEFQVMKQHAYYSYDILKNNAAFDSDMLLPILQHHERVDGSGYPMGVKGDKIHPFAKIIAIADVFDAMTSDRCYRKKASAFDVSDELIRMSSSHLDIEFVTVFVKNISRFFVGNQVMLNSGDQGRVVMINPYHVTRPLVKTAHDFVDLSKDYDLRIVEVLK